MKESRKGTGKRFTKVINMLYDVCHELWLSMEVEGKAAFIQMESFYGIRH